MAKAIVRQRPRRKPAETNGAADESVPDVDQDRDFRDCVILGAVRGAIQLIDDGEQAKTYASDVLRLVSWTLGAPNWDSKINAEVNHG